jgi:hypothetical protein
MSRLERWELYFAIGAGIIGLGLLVLPESLFEGHGLAELMLVTAGVAVPYVCLRLSAVIQHATETATSTMVDASQANAETTAATMEELAERNADAVKSAVAELGPAFKEAEIYRSLAKIPPGTLRDYAMRALDRCASNVKEISEGKLLASKDEVFKLAVDFVGSSQTILAVHYAAFPENLLLWRSSDPIRNYLAAQQQRLKANPEVKIHRIFVIGRDWFLDGKEIRDPELAAIIQEQVDAGFDIDVVWNDEEIDASHADFQIYDGRMVQHHDNGANPGRHDLYQKALFYESPAASYTVRQFLDIFWSLEASRDEAVMAKIRSACLPVASQSASFATAAGGSPALVDSLSDSR